MPTTFKLYHFLFFSFCNVLSFLPASFFYSANQRAIQEKKCKGWEEKLIKKVGSDYFSYERGTMEESMSQHTGKCMKVKAFLCAFTTTLWTSHSCQHSIKVKREIKFKIHSSENFSLFFLRTSWFSLIWSLEISSVLWNRTPVSK